MPQADRRLWCKSSPASLLGTMGGCKTVNGSWIPSNIKLSTGLFMVDRSDLDYCKYEPFQRTELDSVVNLQCLTASSSVYSV